MINTPKRDIRPVLFGGLSMRMMSSLNGHSALACREGQVRGSRTLHAGVTVLIPCVLEKGANSNLVSALGILGLASGG